MTTRSRAYTGSTTVAVTGCPTRFRRIRASRATRIGRPASTTSATGSDCADAARGPHTHAIIANVVPNRCNACTGPPAIAGAVDPIAFHRATHKEDASAYSPV